MKKLALILLLIPSILKSQSTLETEFLKQLNAYRDSLGLSKLEYDSNLSLAAKHLADYKIKVYEKSGLKAFDTIGHKESLDLPGFQEIVTAKERVNKLTNFNFDSEITTGNPESVKKLKRLDSLIAKGFKLTSGNIRRDTSYLASVFLKSFKSSKDHNSILIKKSERNLKVGIYEKDGVIVIVYGSKK